MDEKTLVINSAIAEITPEDFTHPGLRMVRFIFCDDQPNDNQQAIAEEDFEDIIKSGIGTPIKMKFLGEGVGGHLGSIPVGYIKNLFKKTEAGVNQIIADAVLFADEYPDEVDYLIHSHAEGRAPGISWELKYNNSILKDGIEWLKGLVTRAATFVRNPAYGSRTAILALASNKEISSEELTDSLKQILLDSDAATWSSAYINDLPDSSFACIDKGGRHYPYKDASGKIDMPHLRAALSRIGDKSNVQCGKDKLMKAAKSMGMGEAEILTLSPKIGIEGGNNRMDEELQKLQDRIAELETENGTLREAVTTHETTIAELTTERDDLNTAVSEYKTRELIASRTAALVEAGVSLPTDPEKLAAKQTHWASMTEEAFNSTVEDLKESIASAKKAAPEAPASGGTSLAERIRAKSGPDLPRFSAASTDDDEGEEKPTFTGLKSKMGRISRSRASAETE